MDTGWLQIFKPEKPAGATQAYPGEWFNRKELHQNIHQPIRAIIKINNKIDKPVRSCRVRRIPLLQVEEAS